MCFSNRSDELARLIPGEVGSTVSLTLKRDGQVKSVNLVRRPNDMTQEEVDQFKQYRGVVV